MVQVDLSFEEYQQIRKRRANDDLARFIELFDKAFRIEPRAPKKDAAKTSPLAKTGLDPLT